MASGRLEAFGASGGADGKEPAKGPATKKTAPIGAGQSGETRPKVGASGRLGPEPSVLAERIAWPRLEIGDRSRWGSPRVCGFNRSDILIVSGGLNLAKPTLDSLLSMHRLLLCQL